MIILLGNLSLYVTFILSLAVCFLGLCSRPNSLPFALLAGAVLFALILLGYGFITSDMSLKIVSLYSDTNKPLLLKLGGIWANHEGSMLLWLTMLVGSYYMIWPSLRAPQGRGNPLNIITILQAFSIALFSSYIIFTSNPFAGNLLVPEMGFGLNPILQDPALLFHPPSLYLGYVGFSITFALGIAAYIYDDARMFQVLRIWTILCWSVLTLGILLGSRWAYRELGWGGYWFWDPVENASLIPWVFATSLIHLLLLNKKHPDTFKKSILLLSSCTYLAAIIGTFIVRSGLLNSVHTFASDTNRGMFLLAIALSIFTIMLAVWLRHMPAKKPPKLYLKETLILLNAYLCFAIGLVISLATLYPIFLELFFAIKITVGASYFNTIMLPCGLLLLVLMTLAQSLDYGPVRPRALKLEGIVFILGTTLYFYLPALLSFTASVVLVFITNILRRFIRTQNFRKVVVDLLHLSFALLFASILLNATYEETVSYRLKIGEEFTFKGHTVKVEDIEFYKGEGKLIRRTKVQFDEHYAWPENRIHLLEGGAEQESYRIQDYISDFYFSAHSVGDMVPDEIIVTLSHKYAINLIWLMGQIIFYCGLALVGLYIISQNKRG